MSGRFEEYNNVWLYTPEARALADIEAILESPIPDISNNSMSSFGFIHENYRVQELRLFQSYFEEGVQLTELPNSIGNLEKLHTLDLSHNKLTTLPDTIGQLEVLEKFYLDYNEFTKIPRLISKLDDLQQLNFDENLLTDVPSFVANLTYLQSIHLGGNLLEDFPTELGQLPYIRRLVLNRNQITKLDYHVLDDFSKLYVLDLRGNPIPEKQIQKALAFLKLSGKKRRKYYLNGELNDYENPFSIRNITKRIRSDPHLDLDKDNNNEIRDLAFQIKSNYDRKYNRSDKEGVLKSRY